MLRPLPKPLVDAEIQGRGESPLLQMVLRIGTFPMRSERSHMVVHDIASGVSISINILL